MCRRQPANPLPKSLFLVCDLKGEVLADHAFIRDPSRSGITEELVKFRSDQDEVWSDVVIEGLDTKNISCAKKGITSPVPNGEREISQNASGSIFAPL